jgi:hypothetical protein
VSNYDPNLNAVRVIVPSMRDDQTGAPLHSGWLPLGSGWVGAGSGIQVIPQGGATADQPTLGELAVVSVNERGTGVAAVQCLLFSNAQPPPHTKLPTGGGMKPGEIIIRHVSGSLIRMHANGDVEVTTGGDGAVNVATSGRGGISLSTSGAGGIAATTTGSGTILLKSPNPVTIDAELRVTKEVTAMYGTADSVTVSQHDHGNTGSIAAGTHVPRPGS